MVKSFIDLGRLAEVHVGGEREETKGSVRCEMPVKHLCGDASKS